jgi:hypothetical protein
MCPPLIYPQLPHLHNHVLAISSHAICKEFSKAVFLLKYHQNPRVLKETKHRKKEREILKRERKRKKKEKKEKEKLHGSLQIKRGSQYFERRKIFQLQNPFCMRPFSSPPSYHFKNPFQNHLRKFCSSFWTII